MFAKNSTSDPSAPVTSQSDKQASIPMGRQRNKRLPNRQSYQGPLLVATVISLVTWLSTETSLTKE
jgi:hypothetical protein